MEEIYWQFATDSMRIVNFLINGMIFCIFYRPYLRVKKAAMFIGAAYVVVMVLLHLIPFEMTGTFAYTAGIVVVFGISAAIERENLPQKVFLAVTVYLLHWIAGGVSLLPSRYGYHSLGEKEYGGRKRNCIYGGFPLSRIGNARGS